MGKNWETGENEEKTFEKENQGQDFDLASNNLKQPKSLSSKMVNECHVEVRNPKLRSNSINLALKSLVLLIFS